MSSVKALLRKNKSNAAGEFAIAIRVTVNRKSKFTYIGWINEWEWDEQKAKVKSNHPNSKRLNNLISKKLAEADDIILEAESQKRVYSSADIKAGLKNNGNKLSFYEFADARLKTLDSLGKFNRSIAERGILNRIIESSSRDLMFHQIDIDFLEQLKVFLVKKGISIRTVMNYYVFIRTIFNKAISQGIIDAKYYPFGKGKVMIHFPESLKIGLSEDEITSIEELKLEKGSVIWHTRNVFLFSFYLAGMRISDVLTMKWMDLNGDRLNYTMAKNDKIVSLKLPAKAVEIISLYRPKKGAQGFIFPELELANGSDPKDVHNKLRTATKKFNKYLERIATQAKIEKKVTTHIARHSFGNIAGDKVSPQMLQKLYRHSSITTTMGYQSNFIHSDTDEALESVLDF